MFPIFKDHIANQMPFLKEKKLLVACSGGVDSVVLAHLCVAMEMDFALAHCNFGLRGAESDGDEEFVRQLASKWRVPVFVKNFDTQQYAKTNGGSVQMAARELRYQWFSDVMRTEGFDYLLTAHHADDNLETFLINLSRGTGIDGLLGIPEVNDNIVRPMLPFSQNEILEYAKNENIEWREDSSNAETKYVRNKIRHDIVPELKKLHPAFLQNFIKTQDYLQQTSNLVDNHILAIKSELFEEHGDDIKIQIARLEILQPLDANLFGLFKDYGFSEWNDIKNLLTAMSGKQVFSKTHRLLKDRNKLILSRIKEEEEQTYNVHIEDAMNQLPIKLTLEPAERLEKTGQNVVFLDKEKLNFPLVLRNWEKGDYFYPLGMRGRKKLSKFFKDEKMDLIAKEKQWILCSNDQIVWVVGKRADERFKVEDSTQHILKITQVT